MPDFIKNIFAKLRDFVLNLSSTQRIIYSAGILALIIFILVLSFSSSSKYVALFTNLNENRAVAITQKLDSMKIQYKRSGGTIYVEKDKADEVRLELASENLLPDKGIVGLEIFDKSRLSMTDFERQMNYLRALQGELVRMITALDPIEDANVLIVLPKKELYVEEQKPPTAAVRLKLKEGAVLSKKLVRGIINLVSRSVEGLTPDNVTVVDNKGNTLSENLEKTTPSAEEFESRSEQELSLMRKESKILEERVNRKLKNVLGEQRVETIVKVELKFVTTKGEKKIYSPVYKEMGRFAEPYLKEGLPRSKKHVKEYYSGQGAVPGGVPGVESNIPGYKALLNSETTTYGKEEDIVNYELNEEKVQYELAPVEVKRITVAVFVDWVYEPVRLPDGSFKVDARGNIVRRYRPRTDEELKRLENLVKAAVGYDPDRGDNVSVECIQFTRLTDLERIEAEQRRIQKIALLKRIMWPVITLVLILIVFAIFFQQVVVYQHAKAEERAAFDKLRALKELEARRQRELEEEIRREEEAKDHLLRGVIAFTKRNPKVVADIVRTWLFEA